MTVGRSDRPLDKEYIYQAIKKIKAPKQGKKFKGHVMAEDILKAVNNLADKVGALNELGEALNYYYQDDKSDVLFDNDILGKDILGKIAREVKETLAFYNTDEWKKFSDFICNKIPGVHEYVKHVVEDSTSLTDVHMSRVVLMKLAPLYPYIVKELKKKKYDGITLFEIMTGQHDERKTMKDGSQCTVSSVSPLCAEEKCTDENGNEFTKVLMPYEVIIKLAEKAAKDAGLPELIKLKPEKIFADNSKIMNLLQEGKKSSRKKEAQPICLPTNQNMQISLFPQGELPASIMVTIKDLNEITAGTIKITEFERQVLDAVNTMYKASLEKGLIEEATGQTFCAFTSAQLFQVMNYTDKKPSKKQTAEVESALERLGTIWAKIDNSGLLDVKPQGGYRLIRREGTLIAIQKMTFKSTANGRIIEAYKMLTEPILFENAMTMKHIITADAKLFALNDTKSINAIRRSISGYLVRRIDEIKHSPRMNPCIRYDAIFNDVGATRSLKQDGRNKDYIKEVLNHFIKEGYIISFKEYTEPGRQTNVGIKINCETAKQKR